MRRLWLILAGMFVLAVSLYWGMSAYLAVQLSTPSRQVSPPPVLQGAIVRETTLETEDGVALVAWYIRPASEPVGAAVLVHGLYNHRGIDYVQAAVPVYLEAGRALVIPDLRGHGASAQARVTLGGREALDVDAARDFLREEGFADRETVLHGWSMGAAAVLSSAAARPPEAVVADSAFTDGPTAVRDGLKAVTGWSQWLAPGIITAARWVVGIDLAKVRPLAATEKLARQQVPLLLIHGESDAIVPFTRAQSLHAAHPAAETWFLEESAPAPEAAHHVASYLHPDFPRRLGGFLSSLREGG